MTIVHKHVLSFLLVYCTALHMVWAVLLLIDGPAAVGATALEVLYRFIPNTNALATVLAMASWCAVCSLFINKKKIGWALLLPQHVLMLTSAAGVIIAIYLSQFADGVIRPRAFIAADQVSVLLAALTHAAAMIAYALREEESYG